MCVRERERERERERGLQDAVTSTYVHLITQISMSVLRTQMAVLRSAQTLLEVMSVPVALATVCQAMASSVKVSSPYELNYSI